MPDAKSRLDDQRNEQDWMSATLAALMQFGVAPVKPTSNCETRLKLQQVNSGRLQLFAQIENSLQIVKIGRLSRFAWRWFFSTSIQLPRQEDHREPRILRIIASADEIAL